jgi:CHASE3 domain sensor protein
LDFTYTGIYKEIIKMNRKSLRFKIYQDPITKQDFEGIATVTEIIRSNKPDNLFMAYVLFDNDLENEYIRTVDYNDKENKS